MVTGFKWAPCIAIRCSGGSIGNTVAAAAAAAEEEEEEEEEQRRIIIACKNAENSSNSLNSLVTPLQARREENSTELQYSILRNFSLNRRRDPKSPMSTLCRTTYVTKNVFCL